MAGMARQDHDTALVAQMAGCTPVVTRGFLRDTGDCVKLASCDGTVLQVCQVGMDNLRAALGSGADMVVGEPIWTLWGGETQAQIRQGLSRARLGHSSAMVLSSDRFGRLDVEITPVRDAQEVVVNVLVVSRPAA